MGLALVSYLSKNWTRSPSHFAIYHLHLSIFLLF